jgi:F-type H+-transporting ATPase subunit b
MAGLSVLLLAGAAMAAAPAPAAGAPEPARLERIEGAPAGHAEGGEAAGPVARETEGALGTMIVTVLIFVCLFFAVTKMAWNPILNGLRSREKAIRDSIEAAQRAKTEADKTTRELETRMAEAQRQAAQQLQQAKADAQKVADTIRTQAETESAALKDRTLREIDAAKQQALAEINSHAAELGTAVARKILQRSVTVEDQQRLVEESLAQLARKN